jgi:hypothetical protein
MGIENAELQRLYNENAMARKIFDHLLNDYERNMGSISSRHLAWRTKLKEADIKKVYREFEKLHLGKYVEGRWDHLCRFEWALPMRDVARVAAGKGGDPDLVPVESNGRGSFPDNGNGGDEEEAEVRDGAAALCHSYNLRSDFAVSLRLPSNFSPSEAARLADFIRTLPFSENA